LALLKSIRGITAAAPIQSDIELAQVLREHYGADGFRFEAGHVLPLRWDLEGNEIIIARIPYSPVDG
jgi:hypothetical protein